MQNSSHRQHLRIQSASLAKTAALAALAMGALTSCIIRPSLAPSLVFYGSNDRADVRGRVDIGAVLSMKPGTQLSVKLPDQEELKLVLEWVYTSDLGSTWIGHVQGKPGAKAFISRAGQQVYGTFVISDSEARFQGTQDQLQLQIEKLANVQLLGNSDSDALPTPSELRTRAPAHPLARPAISASSPGDEQVAIRVTHIASQELRGAYGFDRLPARMQAARARAVDAFNMSTPTIRLVFSGGNDVNEPGGDLTTMLNYITPSKSPLNPIMRQLLNRKSDGIADIVVLTTRTRSGNLCGVGHIGGYRDTEEQPSRGLTNESQWGYSIVTIDDSKCTDDLTLAHEIGHNLGSMHDRLTDAGRNGAGVTNGSWGYVGQNFATVMAYPQTGKPRIGVFSNPFSFICNGQRCGASPKDEAPTTNALVFQDLRWQVAQWRYFKDIWVAVRGTGGRIISSYNDGPDPGFQKLNCPSSCFTTVPPGRAITLRAVPDAGYKFAAWESVSGCGTRDTCDFRPSGASLGGGPVAYFIRNQ